jgi:hypothetical protein
MGRVGVLGKRQLALTIGIYIAAMTANAVAIDRWTFTRPISANATFYMLVVRSAIPNPGGFLIYAALNLAIAWGAITLLTKGYRVMFWTLLVTFALSIAPLFLAERSAPLW